MSQVVSFRSKSIIALTRVSHRPDHKSLEIVRSEIERYDVRPITEIVAILGMSAAIGARSMTSHCDVPYRDCEALSDQRSRHQLILAEHVYDDAI